MLAMDDIPCARSVYHCPQCLMAGIPLIGMYPSSSCLFWWPSLAALTVLFRPPKPLVFAGEIPNRLRLPDCWGPSYPTELFRIAPITMIAFRLEWSNPADRSVSSNVSVPWVWWRLWYQVKLMIFRPHLLFSSSWSGFRMWKPGSWKKLMGDLDLLRILSDTGATIDMDLSPDRMGIAVPIAWSTDTEMVPPGKEDCYFCFGVPISFLFLSTIYPMLEGFTIIW